MEQLRNELSLVLGETVSRVECISHLPCASLYTLYDDSGYSLPLVAKYFNIKGLAAQEAYKLSMLSREGKVRVPAVYGLVIGQQPPQHEVLLIERMDGISVATPSRTPQRLDQLHEQIVDGILSWHRIDSGGLVGTVDSTQRNRWPAWYRQRVEVIRALIHVQRLPQLTLNDRQVLFRSHQKIAALFSGFDDACVLVHGNLFLTSLLKDGRDDRIKAIINPGTVLWAPREFDLYPLCESAQGNALLQCYLQRAPVAESFVARRWLYLLWEEAARLVYTGQFNRPRFDLAATSLLPWLG